jgi:hypothetical protein
MVRARVVLLALLAPAVARAQPASQPASQPTSQPASQPTSQPVRKLPDWAPRINATVKPAVARLGDPVQVTLRVRHRKGVSANLPLHLELGKFSELSRSDSTREIKAAEEGGFPEVERTFVLRVAAYDLGELILPPVEVTALGPGGELISLKTEPLPIKIQSVLRNEPDPRPRDLEPPVQVFQHTWWLIYTLVALVLVVTTVIITLVVLRHLRTRRERMKPPPPPVPAHVIALERIAAIDVEAYLEEERFKELYLLLSEIMRQYVGRLWGFDALEMTTSEVDEAMEQALVQFETRRRFVEAFDDWDLVKFAKYRPQAEAAHQAVADAEQMVRSTSLVAAPKPRDAGGGDG